jgi:hypothetical protein
MVYQNNMMFSFTLRTAIFYAVIFLCLYSCANDTTVKTNITDSSTISSTGSNYEDAKADSTIVNFLKWYAQNVNRLSQINLVKNNGTNDTTKYYSVDFPATEMYLNELKKTGFISDQYLNYWRNYFKNADDYFKASPQNEGPPEGFDYDLVMLSQDIDEDLKNADRVRVISRTTNGIHLTKDIIFPSGQQLLFSLSRQNNAWLIDKIENSKP